jgi:hypothetical protein
LQEAEILADGIHVLDAFADLTAFVNERLQPGEQAVIAAHGGFGFHFPVLELASQRALQQAAAAGFAAIPGPEAAAWPKDWLFQDTLMLDWALQSLTQELRTEHGLFEPLDRRANRLQLGRCHWCGMCQGVIPVNHQTRCWFAGTVYMHHNFSHHNKQILGVGSSVRILTEVLTPADTQQASKLPLIPPHFECVYDLFPDPATLFTAQPTPTHSWCMGRRPQLSDPLAGTAP